MFNIDNDVVLTFVDLNVNIYAFLYSHHLSYIYQPMFVGQGKRLFACSNLDRVGQQVKLFFFLDSGGNI